MEHRQLEQPPGRASAPAYALPARLGRRRLVDRDAQVGRDEHEQRGDEREPAQPRDRERDQAASARQATGISRSGTRG